MSRNNELTGANGYYREIINCNIIYRRPSFALPVFAMRRLCLHDSIIMHSGQISCYFSFFFFTVVVLSSFNAVTLKSARSCKGITDKGKMRALGQMRTIHLVFLSFRALKGNLVRGKSRSAKKYETIK